MTEKPTMDDATAARDRLRNVPRLAPRRAAAIRGGVREIDIMTNDITLRCLTAGDGPLAILLHGFPDSAESWRRQIPILAAAGYRVVAPWLRGYGQSSRPRGVEAYDIDELVNDVVGLVEQSDDARAALLVGHDWGGVIAWKFAIDHPALVEQLVILNAPHPATFARALRTPDQLARSSYILFFQLPRLPELMLRAGNWALLRRTMRRMVHRPGAWTRTDWLAQRRALGAPGALTAALNYYRAAGRRAQRGRTSVPDAARVRVRTLVLWGDLDPALPATLLDDLGRWVRQLTVRRFAAAGHWVHWDRPNAVADALLAWATPIRHDSSGA